MEESKRWSKELDALNNKPRGELVDGLKAIRLCTDRCFKIPVQ